MNNDDYLKEIYDRYYYRDLHKKDKFDPVKYLESFIIVNRDGYFKPRVKRKSKLRDRYTRHDNSYNHIDYVDSINYWMEDYRGSDYGY